MEKKIKAKTYLDVRVEKHADKTMEELRELVLQQYESGKLRKTK